MSGRRTVIVYGTVMATRLDGRTTVHLVEATIPGGDRLDLIVHSAKRHRGAVRVHWDPTGVAEPRFVTEMSTGTMVAAAAIVAAIVIGGWFLFG